MHKNKLFNQQYLWVLLITLMGTVHFPFSAICSSLFSINTIDSSLFLKKEAIALVSLNEAIPTAMTCTGNADNVSIDNGVTNEIQALGTPDGSFATINDQGDQLGLDLTDVIKAGETYTIRWRRNTSTMDNPSFTVEESIDGINWVAAAGSPFLETSTTFSNNNFVATIDMRYVRLTTTNVYDLDVDAVSYTDVACCTVSPEYTSISKNKGTCNGDTPNNDAAFTINGITNADRADISTAGATTYDGDDYANATTIVGGTITFSNLQHATSYIVRLYDSANGCPVDVNVTTTIPPEECASLPTDLPWTGSECNGDSIMLQNGVVVATCGVTQNVAVEERWTFGLMNLDGSIPASGRSDESSSVAMYHHDSWHIDTIGNVFGIAINSDDGSIYLAASANYSAGFTGQTAVLRYGELAGGTVSGDNDFAAGGAIYKIHPLTGQASVWTILPQQSTTFINDACEDGNTNTRTNSGVGLGNIVFDREHQQFFVTNIEDGRIYRLDLDGNILDTYDPFTIDDGSPGISILEELPYGLAIEPNGDRLFFGVIDSVAGVNAQPGAPGIYSIDLNTLGGFVGTGSATGSGYDNYTNTETLHTTIPAGGPSGSAFVPDNYVYNISDLAFNANGDLIVGMRVGCNSTFFTSYNHYAETNIITLNTGTNIYNNTITELDISVSGDAAVEDNYGGVTAWQDNSGNDIIAVSSSDIIAEIGPHGIAVFNDPPNTGSITPLAGVSYGIDLSGDPKGVGGDVEVYAVCTACNVTASVISGDQSICDGDDPTAFTVDTPASGNATLTFQWQSSTTDCTSGFSNIGGETSETYDAPVIGQTTYYRLIVTNTNGTIVCRDTSNCLTIAVNPNPSITLTDIRCDVLTFPFTYDVDLTTDANTISSTAGTITGNGGGSFTISDIPNGQDITITATITATNCQTQQNVTAPNCPCPSVDPPTSNGDQNYCSGGTIPALTVSVNAGETADWYDMSSGGTLLATGTTSYTPTGAGTYYAEARNIANGCSSNIRTAVTLTEVPQPEVNTSNTAICEGLSIDLDTLVTNVLNTNPVDTAYFLSLQDAIDSTEAIASLISPTSTTPYYVRLSLNNQSPYCYDIDSLSITVNDIVVNAIAICDDNGTGGITTDDTFTVSITATNASAGASGQYLVIYNGNILNGSGTNYGSNVVVDHPDFLANGDFELTLTIRDVDEANCEVIETLPVVEHCSACPPEICMPVKTIKNRK